MLHAQQPDGLGALLGPRAAVEQIPHGLVDMALAVSSRREERGSLALRGDGCGEMLLGEERGEAEVGGGVGEGVREPPGQACRQIGQPGTRAGRVVRCGRVVVR